MPANPADIAALTNDGVVVSTDPTSGAAIKALHPSAQPVGDPQENEMFFDDPAVAQTLLNEQWTYRKVAGPTHLGIELSDAVALGTAAAPLTPVVPTFVVTDQPAGVNVTLRLCSFGEDTETDRYPLELIA